MTIPTIPTNPTIHTDFNQIPRFIEGADVVDIPLTGIEWQLNKYRDYYHLDMEPDFQRAHVWTKGQQIAFVEHVLRGGRNTVIRWNYHKHKQHQQQNQAQHRRDNPAGRSQNAGDGRSTNSIQLVDGKQRLEAVRAFMSNKIPAFGTRYQEYTGRPEVTAGLKFMTNVLRTRAEVLQWYLEINRGNVAHTPEELEKVEMLLVKEIEEIGTE